MSQLHEVAAARRNAELVVLEGFHALKHAIRFGGDILSVWTADAVALEALRVRLAPDLRLPEIDVVDADALAAVVPRAQVLAIARRPAQLDAWSLLALTGPAPVVLLEEPRHLGNLGACVRVAAAAGAAGVLTTGAQDPWHPDALRGGAGLHFALPVRRVRELPQSTRPLIALDPDGEVLGAPGVDPIAPRAVLAFGTERDGISDALLARADRRVALPMQPGVSSLNLATSVAAVLYAMQARAWR
jgi:TrmH family RNA methyltransferase